MDRSFFLNTNLPRDSRIATKYVVELLLKKVYPLLHRIWNKIQEQRNPFNDSVLPKIRDVYMLCTSQIKKCVLSLLDIFKQEHRLQQCLQESRQCVVERLVCCFEKLFSIEELIEGSANNSIDSDNCFMNTTMYFVNWIDQTIEILNKLSSIVYKTDINESHELHEKWKNEVVECVSGLHTSIDELLLSAMTLCRYCLPSDQPVVRVRCQVVLRETKALIGDLIEGDLDSVFHATKESLKLPIMPSNTNLLIDVLKDVVYVLETNTNTALLALLVFCFSCSMSPVEVLRKHLTSKNSDTCPCNVCFDDIADDCSFVKDFDLYNERLLQIGSFAISCSSDDKRVVSLKSSLSSLEALDAHLVPALMLAPDSVHAALLLDSWNQEVLEIQNNVFLIVDPTAFSDKVKQMIHQVLLEIKKENSYNNNKVCSVINMGFTVYEFFNTYNRFEPEALEHQTELLPLLDDLNKVQLECKVVSNMLSSGDDLVYDVKKSKSPKDVSFAQLVKRLKLLYTIVTKINAILSPKESDQNFYEDEVPDYNKNSTRTLYNGATYVNSPRKPINSISRSIFTRTANIRSSTAKFPLAKLTKHLKANQFKELSFSLKLDEICDVTSEKTKPTSILYHSMLKTRSSLRKAVLSRQCKVNRNEEELRVDDNDWGTSAISETDLMDATTSLQITEVLNQINNITNISMALVEKNFDATININQTAHEDDNTNVLRLTINSENTSKFKHVWNITVNSSESDVQEASLTSNITQPSNVTTMERINDLDLVEKKLSELLTLQMETSL